MSLSNLTIWLEQIEKIGTKTNGTERLRIVWHIFSIELNVRNGVKLIKETFKQNQQFKWREIFAPKKLSNEKPATWATLIINWTFQTRILNQPTLENRLEIGTKGYWMKTFQHNQFQILIGRWTGGAEPNAKLVFFLIELILIKEKQWEFWNNNNGGAEVTQSSSEWSGVHLAVVDTSSVKHSLASP